MPNGLTSQMDGLPYGEYLNKTAAVLGAAEAAQDARALGQEAEVPGRRWSPHRVARLPSQPSAT